MKYIFSWNKTQQVLRCFFYTHVFSSTMEVSVIALNANYLILLSRLVDLSTFTGVKVNASNAFQWLCMMIVCVCVCVCVWERERESVCHYRALRQRVRIDYKKDCWKIIHHLTHLWANKSQKQRDTLMFIFIHVIYLLYILLSLIFCVLLLNLLLYYFIWLYCYFILFKWSGVKQQMIVSWN